MFSWFIRNLAGCVICEEFCSLTNFAGDLVAGFSIIRGESG
jgi:hypothetical protein